MAQNQGVCTTMNNQDKNTYVKQQITTALLELLKDKELSEIKIGEITTKANVSRNSFYRNYTDKEDIIKKYVYHLLSVWDKEWKKMNSDSNAKLFGQLFMYLKQHDKTIILIQKRGLFHLFKESYLSIWGPTETMDNMAAYTVVFIANGVLGWIEEWLKRGMCESAETMSSLLSMYGMK